MRLDGYQVIEKLGHGGMGTVWRAIQLSTRRQVALKLLNVGLIGSERARQRFDREVDITSQLQHPHIARIYDSGVHQGAYFYAMELIHGVRLDEYVKSNAPSPREFLQLMVTVCGAVQYAHLRGVIHRDIKPQNILVSADGQPHLLDFGLGRYCRGAGDDESGSGAADWQVVTLEGEWAGTPAYMSPEQAAGKVHDLDSRTDVYSLGVMLYHALTGRFPHDPEGPPVDVLCRIIEGEILRPRTARPDLDPELEALLCKALAKSPAARYATAGALASDIVNYINGEPLSARQLTAHYFLRRKLRKHRWSVAAAMTLLLIVVLGIVGIGLRLRYERDLANKWARAEQTQKTLAELRLADSLVLWGSALRREGNVADAKEQLWQAHDLQVAHGVVPFAADTALLESYAFSPPPLLQFKIAASRGASSSTTAWIKADLGQFVQVDPSGQLRTYDLTAGREIAATGPAVPQVNGSVWVAGNGAYARVVPANGKDAIDAGTDVLQVVDSHSATVRHQFELRGETKSAPVFSTSGRFVAYLVSLPPAKGNIGGRNGAQLIVNEVLRPDAKPVAAIDLEQVENQVFAFVDDGRRLLQGVGQTLNVWDVAKSRRIAQLDLTPAVGRLTQICVSNDGSNALLGYDGGGIVLVNLADCKIERSMRTAGTDVKKISFSPDGTHCLAWNSEGAIWMWDVQSGELVRQYAAEPDPGMTAGFSSDGRTVFACSLKGNAWVWSAAPMAPRTVSRHNHVITSIALSPDARTIAVGHADRTLLLNDVQTGRTLLAWKLGMPVFKVGFAADGASLVAADDQGGFYRFDLRKGQIIQAFEQLRPLRMGEAPQLGKLHPCKTAFSPDASRSISFSIRGAVLWNAFTGQRVEVLEHSPIDAATFSPNGRIIVYGGEKRVKGRNLDNGDRWEISFDRFDLITALCITPDNQTLLVGHHSGTVRALNLSTRKWNWELKPHAWAVRNLTCTRDGRTALSSSLDGRMIVMDVANGRTLQSFNIARKNAASSMSDDGKLIVTATDDGCTAQLYDLNRLTVLRSTQTELVEAWVRLRENPQDKSAATTAAAWYADAECFDWAHRTLTDAGLASTPDGEMINARRLLMNGQRAHAAEAFGSLRERSTDLDHQLYLALCEYAAIREVKP